MGISTHSTPTTLYLFSTQLSTHTPDDNEELHERLTDYFKATGLAFAETFGSYKGVTEKGFLMSAEVVPEDAVRLYCSTGHQEAYIRLENHKHGIYKAYLVQVASGATEFIGYFRSVEKTLIDELGIDYTERPDLGLFWTVWPTDTTVMKDFDEEVNQALDEGMQSLRDMYPL